MTLSPIFNIHIVTSLSSSLLRLSGIIFWSCALCQLLFGRYNLCLLSIMLWCLSTGERTPPSYEVFGMVNQRWRDKIKCGSSIFIFTLTVIACRLCWTKQLPPNSENHATECFFKLSFFSQPYREIFEFFIDNFKTYKPLLSAIKNEYEVTLGKLLDLDLWGKNTNEDMFLQSLVVLDTYVQ